MIVRYVGRLAATLVALIALALAAAPVQAQQPANAQELDAPLAGWRADLDRVETSLARPDLEDETLVRLREELEGIRRGVAAYIAETRQRLTAVQSQLDNLGPPPAIGEAPEPEAAAAERQRLTRLATGLDGAIRTAQVVQTRARQLTETVQERRRTLFSEQLFTRAPSPLALRLWGQIGNDTAAGLFSLRLLVRDWWGEIDRPAWVLGPLILALTVWLGLTAVSIRLINRYRSAPPGEPPTFLHRAASAPGVALARALPPIAAAGVFYAWLLGLELLPGRMGTLAFGALKGFLAVAALAALITTVLAPRYPDWRIFPAGDAAARRLQWLAGAMAAIYGLDVFLADLNQVIVAPLYFTVAQNLFTTGAQAVLLIAILRTPLAAEPVEGETGLSATATAIRLLLWLFVLVVLGAALLGYIALARFLAAQMVTTGALLVLLYLLHLTIEELAAGIADPQTRTGRWLSTRMALAQERREQVAVAVSLLLDAALILAVIPLLLLQWGFDWQDVRAGLGHALFGFQLGTWQVSLFTLLGAVLVFAIGLVATRLVQRWLDTGVLQRARVEAGARSAIGTVVGYIGVVLATLIAFSYTGLDISTIAIVAGALGIGIGFGLQSIVNNFVSGLILLTERRISVGDWIVVGDHEGHVRRISVRATEIETFERSYVIIPNAELITHTVKNWTFRHRRGRVVVEVGVAYGTDPQQVSDILAQCAAAHPDILDNPAPRVLFDDFGDSALQFRLIGFVAEVDKMFVTRSELRYSIAKSFREAGIEIPFPQRDLHLKDIDRLERALAGDRGNSGKRKSETGRAGARDTSATRRPRGT